MQAFGKYRLVEPVAEGGMAEVWRAEAPGAEGFVKEVALKLIRGDHDARGDFVRMFIQEARLASRLSHANIVQVFDFDQVDGRYYIAMEMVRGRTLREIVERCREAGVRLGVARAVHVGAEVARALAYAHRLEEGGRPAGLVHRDVSPQNVLVSFEGEVKLTDFGIARALGASEVTAPGTVKGKLAYMAPEQARGEPVDGRADIFAVGVVVWELCTGRRLFARDNEAATLAAVLGAEPISAPSAWNEAVPPELDAAVLAALERDPARRTASAEDLAATLASIRLRVAARHEDLDLRALMRRLWPEGDTPAPRRRVEPTVKRPAAPQAAAVAAESADDAASTVTVRRPRRSVAPWAAMAAAAVVLAGGGAVVWRARTKASASATSNANANATPTSNLNSNANATPTRSDATAGTASTAEPPVLPPPAQRGEGRGEGPGTAPATAPATAPPTAKPPRRPQRVASTSPPRPAPAPATVAITSAPWGFVHIDGVNRGESPLEARLAPGRHVVRVVNPGAGADEVVVDLEPGGHWSWRARPHR